MIKWPITYTDFNGEVRTETFHFHVSEAELAELELIYHQFGTDDTSGFAGFLQDTIRSGDGQRVVDVIKDLIKRAFGIRTPDGRSFIKTESDYLVFAGTPAYSSLFMSLAYNPDITAKFFVGILPTSMQGPAEERLSAEDRRLAEDGFRPGADTSRPVPPVAGGTPTQPVATGDARGFPVDNTPSLPPIGGQQETVGTAPESDSYKDVMERAKEIAAEEGHTIRIGPNDPLAGTSPNSVLQAQEELTEDHSEEPAEDSPGISYEDHGKYQTFLQNGVNATDPEQVAEYQRLYALHNPGADIPQFN